MSKIEPDVEAYGKYGRISALADYLEVSSISGHTTKKALLSDFIVDNDWNVRGLIDPSPDLDAEFVDQDDAEDAADRIWGMLRQRSYFLGEAYPFELTNDRFFMRDDFEIQNSPYASLLAITIVHAYGLETPVSAHQVFEAVVAGVFRNRVSYTVNFGEIRRNAGSFPEALEQACDQLQLKARPEAGPRHRYAQDEKVDVISHCFLGDGRPGTWAIIGQVTCAKTDDWERKISETSHDAWKLFLGIHPHPMIYLAIPHHAEGELIDLLVIHRQRVVIDRIRLVRNKSLVDTPGEEEILKVLLASDSLAIG